MTDENRIQIGDNLCFVAKDQFMTSSYKTVAITINDEEDLERISDFFNSKSFVQAFRADSLIQAVDLANNFIVKKQKERVDDLGSIHKDKQKQENPPGFNSFVIDQRDPNNIIQAIPGLNV